MQSSSEPCQLLDPVQRYCEALDAIENALKQPNSSPPSSEQFLELLIARQAIQVELINTPPTTKKSLLKKINQLDDRLRKQIDSIQRSTQLANWRSNLNPPLEAWSWFLESLPKRWWDYDTIWSFFSLVLLTFSLSLLVDISSRLWGGGPDAIDAVGTASIIVQSLIALLAGGAALSKLGLGGLVKPIEQFLSYLRIPKRLWHEISLGLSILLFAFLFISHRHLLPILSIKHNQSGENDYAKGQLLSAEYKYNRALKLNPNNGKAHYNLGRLYEAVQDFEPASKEYQLAAKGGYYKAFNHLAHLYSSDGNYSDGNYSKAVAWLLKGLEKNNNGEEDKKIQYSLINKLATLHIRDKKYFEASIWLEKSLKLTENDLKKTYVINENWGWVLVEYLDQGSYEDDYKRRLYEDAYNRLRKNAHELEQVLKLSPQEGAFSHCLLAEVLEKRNSKKEATKQWEHCVTYGDLLDLDKGKWIERARQRWKNLKAEGY